MNTDTACPQYRNRVSRQCQICTYRPDRPTISLARAPLVSESTATILKSHSTDQFCQLLTHRSPYLLRCDQEARSFTCLLVHLPAHLHSNLNSLGQDLEGDNPCSWKNLSDGPPRRRFAPCWVPRWQLAGLLTSNRLRKGITSYSIEYQGRISENHTHSRLKT